MTYEEIQEKINNIDRQRDKGWLYRENGCQKLRHDDDDDDDKRITEMISAEKEFDEKEPTKYKARRSILLEINKLVDIPRFSITYFYE